MVPVGVERGKSVRLEKRGGRDLAGGILFWGHRGGELLVEGSGAVEELEVEGGGGLAVHFPSGAGLHGHCWLMMA